MPTHNCSYCNQLVNDGDPYCAKCGGPQTYKSGGVLGVGAVSFSLDPWIITAPKAKERFQVDDEAVRALVNTWRNDSDHGRTRQIQQEINEALARGSLAPQDAYYYCCPWSPIYIVNRDITISNQTLRRGQQFTFDVSAEAIPAGGAFKRELLVGNFNPTDQVDYCLPGEADNHDD